jgi:hypothetical protein
MLLSLSHRNITIGLCLLKFTSSLLRVKSNKSITFQLKVIPGQMDSTGKLSPIFCMINHK